MCKPPAISHTCFNRCYVIKSVPFLLCQYKLRWLAGLRIYEYHSRLLVVYVTWMIDLNTSVYIYIRLYTYVPRNGWGGAYVGTCAGIYI